MRPDTHEARDAFGELPKGAREVFRGLIYSVYHYPEQMFDGSTKTFEILKRADTVEVLAVTPDHEVVICHETQPGRDQFISLPGGRIDQGETPLEAAVRELREETGYTSHDWAHLISVHPSDKMVWMSHTFVARDAMPTHPTQLDAGEQIVVTTASLAELMNIVLHDDFRDREFALYLLRIQRDPAQLARFSAMLSGGVPEEGAPSEGDNSARSTSRRQR